VANVPKSSIYHILFASSFEGMDFRGEIARRALDIGAGRLLS
jgi:hypothetical protein